jgi:transposase
LFAKHNDYALNSGVTIKWRDMQRLEAKSINGRTYYYLSLWGWKNGKCRRLSQKYLGKLEDIARALEGAGPAPEYAVVLDWGLPQALWQEAERAQVGHHVDQLCPKRAQGLSIGDYIGLAAINRACEPVSKQGMPDWFSRTCLPRLWPEASAAQLTSQHFWDHMDLIEAKSAQSIWQQLMDGVLQREQIPLSEICYDGTNFYTFIDTFNLKCHVAKRGKNKQGRCNLRQVSYALFCTTDGHLPLFYDVYEGHRNDAKEFPQVLEKFQRWLKERAGSTWKDTKPTLIFDKGNNSADNFALVDALELPYVGSVKLDEHPDLAQVSNQDARWQPATAPALEGTKSWRVQKEVYGKERTLVMTCNQNLFDSQSATVQNDLTQALSQLAAVQKNLQDRAVGLIKGGTPPTVESIKRKCDQILHRQHLRQLVAITLTLNAAGLVGLSFEALSSAQEKLKDTYLGKTLLITAHQQWTDAQVIRAYRSQFVIEEIFHEMKDRRIGAWWPLHHWTDSKIQVHGLYCTIAVLLRALLWRRAQRAGLHLSMNCLLEKLGQMRQVINVFPSKRAGQPRPEQSVLTKRDETQEKLIEILKLQNAKSAV